MQFKRLYSLIKESFGTFLFGAPNPIPKLQLPCLKEVISVNENIRCYALFRYRDPNVKNFISEMKYRHNSALFELSSELLAKEITSFFTCPLLIPVPLSKERKKQRGYNQTEEVVKRLEGKIHENALAISLNSISKIKDTPPQTHLKRNERLQNLSGAFIVNSPEVIHSRDIIIFDDVITTGSTVSEIAKTLKKSGAARIIVLALAH